MSIARTTKHNYPVKFTSCTFEYAGAVIEEYSQEDRIMSDVWAMVRYARVWDSEAGAPKVVRLFTWDFTSPGDMVTTTIDATPEVLAAYEAWKANEAAKAAKAEAARQAALVAWEAKQPRRGRTIKVVKGRKVPKGIVGVCIWIGDGYYGKRVGIKTDDGEVYWTAATNVEAVAA